MTEILRNGGRFAWWRSFEHFCVPGSSPEAISRDLGRVEDHLRAQTTSYRKRPIVGRDDGSGWRIAYIAQKDELEDIRERRPAQADKYDAARAGGTRGNLGPIPPVDETSIVPVDLDEDDEPDADASPRLWMEIRRDTNSEGLGEFLFAAQYKDDDSTRPAFSRVWTAEPGDMVLHYWKQAVRGLSVVANQPEEDAGGVYVELRDRILFPEPITLDDLRVELEGIVEVYLDSRGDARFGQFAFQINFPGTDQQHLHGAAVTYFTAVHLAWLTRCRSCQHSSRWQNWICGNVIERSLAPMSGWGAPVVKPIRCCAEPLRFMLRMSPSRCSKRRGTPKLNGSANRMICGRRALMVLSFMSKSKDRCCASTR